MAVLKQREDLRKLVYLHAALFETLKLYPPVAFQHMARIQADVLPSGHAVDKVSKFYYPFIPPEKWRVYGLKIAWVQAREVDNRERMDSTSTCKQVSCF